MPLAVVALVITGEATAMVNVRVAFPVPVALDGGTLAPRAGRDAFVLGYSAATIRLMVYSRTS